MCINGHIVSHAQGLLGDYKSITFSICVFCLFDSKFIYFLVWKTIADEHASEELWSSAWYLQSGWLAGDFVSFLLSPGWKLDTEKTILCFLNSLIHYHRYVDDTMRIGRDDKGNIFILERSSSAGENVVE